MWMIIEGFYILKSILVSFSKENTVTGDESIITRKQVLNPGSLMYRKIILLGGY